MMKGLPATDIDEIYPFDDADLPGCGRRRRRPYAAAALRRVKVMRLFSGFPSLIFIKS